MGPERSTTVALAFDPQHMLLGVSQQRASKLTVHFGTGHSASSKCGRSYARDESCGCLNATNTGCTDDDASWPYQIHRSSLSTIHRGPEGTTVASMPLLFGVDLKFLWCRVRSTSFRRFSLFSRLGRYCTAHCNAPKYQLFLPAPRTRGIIAAYTARYLRRTRARLLWSRLLTRGEGYPFSVLLQSRLRNRCTPGCSRSLWYAVRDSWYIYLDESFVDVHRL